MTSALIFWDRVFSPSFLVRTWKALLKPARLVLKILYLLAVIALGKSKMLKVALYITRNFWVLDPPPVLNFVDRVFSFSFPVRTWNVLLKTARLDLKILYLLEVIALGKIKNLKVSFYITWNFWILNPSPALIC